MTHPAITRLDQLGIGRSRLVVDSRAVKPGDVFAAFPGHSNDGRRYIESAVRAGAAAVFVQPGEGCSQDAAGAAPVIAIENLARNIGAVADEFYGRPSQSLRVVGVTGTNGKTTVASWLAQAYDTLAGKRGSAGMIGTLGSGLLARLEPSANTTPDAASVQTTLRELLDAGARSVAMEVSSHALDQGRVSGVRFDATVFTNLTQDHLDYHQTMEAYGAAKAKLFTDYPTKHRIVNADDDFGARMIARKLPQTVSYGMNAGLVRSHIARSSEYGMQLVIASPWGELDIATTVIGRFNAYNMTAVAATLLSQGFDPESVTAALARVNAAAGRMQRVTSSIERQAQPTVYVDYAHTPDALAKALSTLRDAGAKRLVAVFGCGGDRDRTKRSQMGDIAATLADSVLITSDNPRSESPESITADIEAGVPTPRRNRAQIIVDRREAIHHAIANAGPNDVILVAGKGHEDYQEVAGVRHHFSDVEVAQQALNVYAAREVSHAH
ncbi:MAG: UDP-N-acetylmuramoyl-L-alanyl-D-glutamate--2,6-diaminopimelate ligase [Betaproteobacteria bacterium]|nr:MAG: UDP-N-acetylmuramoyl-L-alanyl-D-glutamate--2,6-diaminopimelate ligase [Betaproteobacteria bacterium]